MHSSIDTHIHSIEMRQPYSTHAALAKRKHIANTHTQSWHRLCHVSYYKGFGPNGMKKSSSLESSFHKTSARTHTDSHSYKVRVRGGENSFELNGLVWFGLACRAVQLNMFISQLRIFPLFRNRFVYVFVSARVCVFIDAIIINTLMHNSEKTKITQWKNGIYRNTDGFIWRVFRQNEKENKTKKPNEVTSLSK